MTAPAARRPQRATASDLSFMAADATGWRLGEGARDGWDGGRGRGGLRISRLRQEGGAKKKSGGRVRRQGKKAAAAIHHRRHSSSRGEELTIDDPQQCAGRDSLPVGRAKRRA